MTEVRDLPPVRAVLIDDVHPSKRNPRVIPDRAVEIVAASLTEFGWQQPLVVDTDGVLIVGHTRYRAARKLGLQRVPVVSATDLTPEQVQAFRIADNRTHDFTSWDLPDLAQQLDELAGDFSEVLALADWEAVSAEFDDAARKAAESLDLPDEVRNALDGGFILNVCFESKEKALAAEAAIMELPGAFDVRHDF